MPQPPDPDARPAHLYLSFAASPVAVRDNLVRMLAVPPLSGLSAEARGDAELVLAEVLNNVAEHAYPDRVGPVSVMLCRVKDGVVCRVVDQGAAMPGHRLPEGELTAGPSLALDDLPEGGFGWHLIRSLTRDLVYVRDVGENRLSFRLPDAEHCLDL